MGSLRRRRRERRERRERGFTLIEAMTVVVIVGVLALLAVVGYKRWIRSAYIGEAQDMVANIRAAEESFLAENTVYLKVSKDLSYSSLYPSTSPTASLRTAWGAPCAGCVVANGWDALNVRPVGALRFGYAVVAGNATAPPAIVVNGVSQNLSSMAGVPWYVAEAVCDYDGVGTPDTTIYGLSTNNQLLISNEGN